MEWYPGGSQCYGAVRTPIGCDRPAPPERLPDTSSGRPTGRETPMTRRVSGHSAILGDQLPLFGEEAGPVPCAEDNLHPEGARLVRESYVPSSGLDSGATVAGSLRERRGDGDRPEEPGGPAAPFALPATQTLAALEAPVQTLAGERQATHEADDPLVDAATTGLGATDRDLCASPRGTANGLVDAGRACAAVAPTEESLRPGSVAGAGRRARSAAAPVPGNGHGDGIAVSTDMPAPGAPRPHGYDRALERVRRAELAIRDDENAGERALVAHNHALLVALRMGMRAGRSLTRVASDTRTSASHLSRLQGAGDSSSSTRYPWTCRPGSARSATPSPASANSWARTPRSSVGACTCSRWDLAQREP